MFEQFRAGLRKGIEYRRNARMTRPEFEAARLQRFREFVRYVNASSPYYARLVRERGIDLDACLPADFPPMTRAVLRANFDDIVTDRRITFAGVSDFLGRSKNPLDRFLDRYTVIRSSGTSGDLGYFLYSPADLGRGLAMGRRRDKLPPRRTSRGGRIRIAFFGGTEGHFAGVTMMCALRRWPASMFVRVELFEVNNPLQDTIDGLNRFQPDVLVGYTTALLSLAEKQRAGTLNLALAQIVCSGEPTTKADKEVLKGAFGAVLVNGYGCSEHLRIGRSEPDGDEIVLYDDDLILEPQPDHVLVTNLFNHTLPLIRYRMGDILQPMASQRHAPYLVIDGLVGREEMQPVFRNQDGIEEFVSPHSIRPTHVDGVRRFQMRLLSDTRFDLLICLEDSLDAGERAACLAAMEQRMRAVLSRKRMDNVVFDVLEVDDLPVDPVTRKFRVIVKGG